jgi:hypothetical protein
MRTALKIFSALLLIFTGSSDARANDTSNPHTARFAEYLQKILASTPETFQFTSLLNISVSPPVGAEGGASLTRSKNGLTMRVMAADLEPGHAYTYWWVIFNDPSGCAQIPCNFPDLMTPAVRAAVHYGSGAVAGADGAANVSFSTTSGGPPAGAAGNPSLPERGLVTDRGFKAEVHLVIVDHGIPEVADLTSPNPDVAGTWAWELTHPRPPGPTWVRAAIFLP